LFTSTEDILPRDQLQGKVGIVPLPAIIS
jgi:hypothetical protein